jgi:integrase
LQIPNLVLVRIWSGILQMASIQKRNSSFRVRITREGKSTLCATFYNRLEALQWAKQTEAQLRLGLYEEPQSPHKPNQDVLFEEAASHYMKTHSIHKKIVRCESSRLRILIKRWGAIPVKEVDKLAVLELRDDLLKLGRSGETINHYFNTISKLFQMLEGDWDLPIPNPIKGIRRMPCPQGRTKRVNASVEEQLLLSCRKLSLPLLSSIIEFAIQTGMRRGELMGLDWVDIDLPNRKAYLHTSKNGEPRQVPLTQRAVAVLQSLGKKDEGRVFPMSMNVLRNHFERVRANCKSNWSVTGANPFDGLRFHDLRHEALSRLSDAGLNVIELSHISGHKTLGMLKRYVHCSHQAIFAKLDSPDQSHEANRVRTFVG